MHLYKCSDSSKPRKKPCRSWNQGKCELKHTSMEPVRSSSAVRAVPVRAPAGWAESLAQGRDGDGSSSSSSAGTKNEQPELLPGHFRNAICKAKPCLVILGLLQMAVISMEIFLLGSANSGWGLPKWRAEGSAGNKQTHPISPIIWSIFHTLPLLLFRVLDLYYNQSESWLSSCEWAS